MADAVRVIDDKGFPIQENNPFPVDTDLDSNLFIEIQKLNKEIPLFSQLINGKLNDIIKELKILNVHMNIINSSNLDSTEVEV